MSLLVTVAGLRPVRPIAHLVEILTREPQFRGFPQDFHKLGRLTLILTQTGNRRAGGIPLWAE